MKRIDRIFSDQCRLIRLPYLGTSYEPGWSPAVPLFRAGVGVRAGAGVVRGEAAGVGRVAGAEFDGAEFAGVVAGRAFEFTFALRPGLGEAAGCVLELTGTGTRITPPSGGIKGLPVRGSMLYISPPGGT